MRRLLSPQQVLLLLRLRALSKWDRHFHPPPRKGLGTKGVGTSVRELRRALEERPWMVEVADREHRLLEASTLWDFPDSGLPGVLGISRNFHGVTPARVVWNVIKRYTRLGDVVIDPMAGSGTTVDVARAMGRGAIGLDLNPSRSDICRADARRMPLRSECADLVFVDSPYGDVISYSTDRNCLGKIAAEDPAFMAEMEAVGAEIHRVLRTGGFLAWVISDQYRHGLFQPVGFRLWSLLTGLFEPIDIVCLVRRSGRTLNPEWEHRARSRNFFLRGFSYLLLFRKCAGVKG